MVNLTYLNDASVFWNLKTRYQAKLIHTYSGKNSFHQELHVAFFMLLDVALTLTRFLQDSLSLWLTRTSGTRSTPTGN